METTAIVKKRKTRNSKYTWKDYGFLLSLTIIPIVYFLVFYVYVNFEGFLMAFQNYDAVTGREYFTLENFAKVFEDIGKEGNRLGEGIKNTLLTWLTGKLVSTPLTVMIAFFMLKGMKGSYFFKVAFYIPAMISSVANVYTFTYFVGVNGPLYEIWQLVGLEQTSFPIMFVGSAAMPSILFYGVWGGLGFATILHAACMNRIPLDLFESAKLDGAGFLAEFFNIVLPSIWPILATEIVTSLAGCCSGAGLQLLTTQGSYGTYTVGYYMFETVRYAGDPSQLYYPAAFGMVLSAVLIPLVFGVRKLVYSFWNDNEF